MLILQATDPTNTLINESNNFLIEIAKDEPLLAVGLAIYIISQVSIYFQRKAERSDAKTQAEKEEKYRTEVTSKLGEISVGIVTTDSTVKVHEKEIAENRGEIKTLTKEQQRATQERTKLEVTIANFLERFAEYFNATNQKVDRLKEESDTKFKEVNQKIDQIKAKL